MAFSALLDLAALAFEDEPSVESAVYILEGFGRRFCGLPDRSAQSPARLSRHCDFRWQGREAPRFHFGLMRRILALLGAIGALIAGADHGHPMPSNNISPARGVTFWG